MNIQPELSLREATVERILELAYAAATEHREYWHPNAELIYPNAKLWVASDSYAALKTAIESVVARPPQQGADEPATSLVAAAERVLTVYGLDQTDFTERMDVAMENLHAALPKADAPDRMQWVSGPCHVAEFSNALCARGTYGCDSLHGQSGAPQTAHSKSEYKRRVALGDPRILPPAEPASEPAPETAHRHFWSRPDESGRRECLYCAALALPGHDEESKP